jgi:hypothetical protein
MIGNPPLALVKNSLDGVWVKAAKPLLTSSNRTPLLGGVGEPEIRAVQSWGRPVPSAIPQISPRLMRELSFGNKNLFLGNKVNWQFVEQCGGHGVIIHGEIQMQRR